MAVDRSTNSTSFPMWLDDANVTALAAAINTAAGTGASAQQVQGTAADGAAVTGKPVLTAGFDGTNVQTFLTDTSGRAYAAMFLSGVGFEVGGGNVAADALATGTVAAASQAYNFVFNGVTWDRRRGSTIGAYSVLKPETTGGLSIARLVASAGANIKASAGQLFGGVVTNSNAAIRFLHLYNKATAATLSTDTPVATFALPPNASVQITTDGLGAAFATGISWAFTTDNIAIPTTAGATTDVHGTLLFK